MFATQYYTLVASLREYALDADTKGFDVREIIDSILEGVSAADARRVRLLYGYYDCENLAALRSGRTAFNELGNLSHEELEEELRSPQRLPEALARVVRAYADPEGEEAESVDTAQRFEKELFEAYYAACEGSRSRLPARMVGLRPHAAQRHGRRGGTYGRPQHRRGGGRPGRCGDQLRRSSAADFGLRGELPGSTP